MKILVVADIHINDYANRNPSNRYRLLQTRKVAQNIIDTGRASGCDIIVFAGDIIEKSVIRPYVQSEVKYFLDTIMANFREGYIIWGNHDLDGKSVDQSISDACLGVMLPGNLHYAHQQIIEIDGRKIGFCNWMPEFDLSWIPGKVDILFTHATICYNTDEGARLYESQKLDESKFDLAICGDIHRKGQLGKYVSVGCAQRCKLGDPEEASGVVVDCASKTWDWVNLNPYDNLIKFKTTQELSEEGWHEEEGTWYVYKQDNSFVSGLKNVKVDAWEEIGALIDNAISSAGLQVIHNEVLKSIENVDAGGIDFNFTLLHLHCENWRSIESLDIDFKDMDKILVQGANGSGKSSFLSAIKYALVDVGDTTGLTSLKPFVMFGKKDCMTEVTFLYQGNICKIRRGTNTYGLWINDEPLKYSDKRSFEKDVRERFGFIRYLNAFFFDADRMSLLKSSTPEEITEITSKFLKLDRLDTLNETSKIIRDQVYKEASEWITKYKETESLLGYIDTKLGSISLPTVSKEDLLRSKEVGLDIQRKNQAWNEYSLRTSRLQAEIQALKDKKAEYTERQVNSRPVDIIQREIQELRVEISGIQGRILELGNSRSVMNSISQELERLKAEGNKAWKEAQEIGVGKVCRACGQVIKTSEASEHHKQELLSRVEEIRPLVQDLQAKLIEATGAYNNSAVEIENLNSQVSNLTAEVSQRLSEESGIKQTGEELSRVVEKLGRLETELLGLGVCERVDLPEGFMQKMSELELGISAWNLYETTMADRIAKVSELETYQAKVNGYTEVLKNLDMYIKLTGPTGIIFEEIFNKLSEHFSSNEVKYVVERRGKGSREHLSLTPYFNNSGNWVNIQMCSSGQRIMLDLDYMSKIMSGSKLGVCVLDEFLKPLDSGRLEDAIEILSGINLGCIILTSHAESIPAFYNRTILTSLDGNGKTNIIQK